MFYKAEFAWPHAISLFIALLLVLAAWRRPAFARIAFAALFAWASLTNAYTSSLRPSVYLEYAPLAVSAFYREFILGFFASHIRVIVASIASAQAAIAIGSLCPAPISRLAFTGAVVFLVAIAPLGVGSAFPATLIMALAAAMLAVKPDSRGSILSALRSPARVSAVEAS